MIYMSAVDQLRSVEEEYEQDYGTSSINVARELEGQNNSGLYQIEEQVNSQIEAVTDALIHFQDLGIISNERSRADVTSFDVNQERLEEYLSPVYEAAENIGVTPEDVGAHSHAIGNGGLRVLAASNGDIKSSELEIVQEGITDRRVDLVGFGLLEGPKLVDDDELGMVDVYEPTEVGQGWIDFALNE